MSYRTIVVGAEQVGGPRRRNRGLPADERAYSVMADTDVEVSRPAGALRTPAVTVDADGDISAEQVTSDVDQVRSHRPDVVLVAACRFGYRRFLEARVRIEERLTSAVSTTAVWAMLVNTLAVFYRLRVLRWYDAPRSAGAALIVDTLAGAEEVPAQ